MTDTNEFKQDEEKTIVIFRKWRTGNKEVIALFPEIAANYSGTTCNSFEHVGQHGSANLNIVVGYTKLATESEYADLKKELESYPYGYNLDVRKRVTSEMNKNRHNILKGYK